MKANDVEVYAICTACGWTLKPYPLDPIIEKLGPDYSLFDKRPRCRQRNDVWRCQGKVNFLYRSAGTHGTPYRPCTTEC